MSACPSSAAMTRDHERTTVMPRSTAAKFRSGSPRRGSADRRGGLRAEHQAERVGQQVALAADNFLARLMSKRIKRGAPFCEAFDA